MYQPGKTEWNHPFINYGTFDMLQDVCEVNLD